MISVLAAVLSGIMFYLSQGFDNVWVLAWFAPLPLLWLTYGRAPTWQVMAASAFAMLASVGYLFQLSYTPPLAYLHPAPVVLRRAVLRRGLVCALHTTPRITARDRFRISSLLDRVRISAAISQPERHATDPSPIARCRRLS